MKKITILTSLTAVVATISTLSGCAMYSMAEKEALAKGAISDIRGKPKEVHLAYLKCYALEESKKDTCRHAVERNHNLQDIITSSSWEYVLPYRYEAERLGFAQFLRDNGRTCKGINKGLLYNKEAKAYEAVCTGGNAYKMRFNRKAGQWVIVK